MNPYNFDIPLSVQEQIKQINILYNQTYQALSATLESPIYQQIQLQQEIFNESFPSILHEVVNEKLIQSIQQSMDATNLLRSYIENIAILNDYVSVPEALLKALEPDNEPEIKNDSATPTNASMVNLSFSDAINLVGILLTLLLFILSSRSDQALLEERKITNDRLEECVQYLSDIHNTLLEAHSSPLADPTDPVCTPSDAENACSSDTQNESD